MSGLLRKGVVLDAAAPGQKLERQLLATAYDKQVPQRSTRNA